MGGLIRSTIKFAIMPDCTGPLAALGSANVQQAVPRFELGNKGFAILCLTTWPYRHRTLHTIIHAYQL